MNPEGTYQLPPQLSTLAPDVDWVYYFIYWLSVAFFVVICAVMVWFVIRYRRTAGVRSTPTGHNTPLEIFWTFTPLILLFFLFEWGFDGYMKGLVAPPNAIQMRVRGQQWSWEFEQPNGITEIGELKVPVGRPVKLIMSSNDVLHSFFVPDFRVKRDVIPGMFTTVWFEATHVSGHYEIDGGRPCTTDGECGRGNECIPNAVAVAEGENAARCGTLTRCGTGQPECPSGYECHEQGYCWNPVQVFCTEYCGAPEGSRGNSGHSAMLARVNVMTQSQYDRFMEEGPPMPVECETAPNPTACWGEQLYTKNGCNACHFTDGQLQQPAPNWGGIFSRTRTVGGQTVETTEDYLRESILQPQAKIVDGYTGVVMPPYRMSENQLNAIIAYMRTLR